MFNFTRYTPVFPVSKLVKIGEGHFERVITWVVGYESPKPKPAYTFGCARRPAQDPAIAAARAKLVADELAYKRRNFPDRLATQTDWRENRRYGVLGTR